MAESTESKNSTFPSVSGTVLCEETLNGHNVQLVISDDEMSASLSLYPNKSNKTPITSQAILTLLDQHNIIDGIQNEAIDTLCTFASKGKKQDSIVVAATYPPTPGENGWLEPLIRTAADTDTEFNENEDGKLDLYTLNLFTCVEPEQKIAILHPPELGEASTTVTGKVLAPLLGKELQIGLGSGVRIEDNGTSFISEISGRADLSENILSVSEDYIIHGDVDMHVGNINFPGFCQVSGDVLDNFDINADKGIEVVGTVGSCHLITEGDITIGSMAGNEDGMIRCSGNLTANYLNGVTVECMGTVTVKYEIRNCIIKSAEKVIIENGVISGGHCVALQGIEAKDVGAEAGIATRLTSGVYFPEEDQLQMLKTQQKSINIQNQFIKRSLGPLAAQSKKDDSLTGAIQKRLEILQERLELLIIMQKEVKEQLNNFVFTEHDGNAKVNVHRRLKEKVKISLDMVTEEIRLEHHGPLSVVADSTNGTLRFCDLSPLKINATEMQVEELEETELEEESLSGEGESE